MDKIHDNTNSPAIELPGKASDPQAGNQSPEINLPGSANATTPVPDEFPNESY
ncbi:MAG: hypothetical protein HFE84_08200 [Lachnospiraceae bacterium]|nr:hypothetical protein [Lachnospiraceae bacterium]